MNRLMLTTWILFGVLAAGCAHNPHVNVGRTPLPQGFVRPPALEFNGPEGGWPASVKGATNVHLIPWQDVPGSLTEEDAVRLRTAALRDSRVRELLGERFAYVSAAEVEPEKAAPRRQGAPQKVRLTFFSHAHNTMVEVVMQGVEVQSAAQREGASPREGEEEIRSAVALAERDPRLANKLAGLTGRALITAPDRGQPGYGHRVLDLTFGTDEEDLPHYFALVDLTTETVLEAAPIAARERRQP